VQWEPRRRVNLAVAKLQGRDPARLMLADLALNPAVKKFKTLAPLTRIVMSAYSSLPGGATTGISSSLTLNETSSSSSFI